jgi:hypothetical protein
MLSLDDKRWYWQLDLSSKLTIVSLFIENTLILNLIHNIFNLHDTACCHMCNIMSVKEGRWSQPLFCILDSTHGHG